MLTRTPRGNALPHCAVGSDPVQARPIGKIARASAAATTFEVVAREFHGTKAAALSPGYSERWLRITEGARALRVPLAADRRAVHERKHDPRGAATHGYSNDEMTAHGFRAMARTLIAENLHGVPADVVEAQLAHGKAGPLGMAYDRAEYMAQRRALVARWADYLDKLRTGADVLPFKAA